MLFCDFVPLKAHVLTNILTIHLQYIQYLWDKVLLCSKFVYSIIHNPKPPEKSQQSQKYLFTLE